MPGRPGGQDLLQQQLAQIPSCPALVPPTAWPVLACGLTSSCLCSCNNPDAATTDQNPLPSGVSPEVALRARGAVRARWPQGARMSPLLVMAALCGPHPPQAGVWPSAAFSNLPPHSELFLGSKEASRAASHHQLWLYSPFWLMCPSHVSEEWRKLCLDHRTKYGDSQGLRKEGWLLGRQKEQATA